MLKLGDITPLKNPDKRITVKMYEEKELSKKQKGSCKRSTDALTGVGYSYTLLMYPKEVQKMIVQYFVYKQAKDIF